RDFINTNIALATFSNGTVNASEGGGPDRDTLILAVRKSFFLDFPSISAKITGGPDRDPGLHPRKVTSDCEVDFRIPGRKGRHARPTGCGRWAWFSRPARSASAGTTVPRAGASGWFDLRHQPEAPARGFFVPALALRAGVVLSARVGPGLAEAGAEVAGAGGVALLAVEQRAHQLLQVGRLRLDEQFVHRGDRHVVEQAQGDAEAHARQQVHRLLGGHHRGRAERAVGAGDAVLQRLPALAQQGGAGLAFVHDDLRDDLADLAEDGRLALAERHLVGDLVEVAGGPA